MIQQNGVLYEDFGMRENISSCFEVKKSLWRVIRLDDLLAFESYDAGMCVIAFSHSFLAWQNLKSDFYSLDRF